MAAFEQTKEWHEKAINLYESGANLSTRKIAKILGMGKTQVGDYLKYYRESKENLEVAEDVIKVMGELSAKTPIKTFPKHWSKVLVIDIETSPVLGYVWSLWKQNIGLNQIKEDWHLLSFAAKWLGDSEDKIIYMDQRNEPNIEDDTNLLYKLWELLDSADFLITQNGKSFDIKKIRARMVMKGFKPFSPIKHIDTLEIAKKTFGFTSNKLEYMTDKLCETYTKSKHKKFVGFELWSECLKGNLEAWQEMEEYNKLDILSLEELYYILAPWSDRLPNPNLYTEDNVTRCNCGSENIIEDGYATTEISKFKRYRCKDCGHIMRGRKNLLSKEKRETILSNYREN